MQFEKKPMYQFIVDDLKRKISEGEFGPEDPFPTQIELARLYNTSEITSRRALTELVNEGLIYRIRRKGTFVKEQPLGSGGKAQTAIKRIYFVYHSDNMHIFNHRFYSDLLIGLHEVCEENKVDFFACNLGTDLELPADEDAGYVLITHVPGSEEIPMDKLRIWKEQNRRIVTVHFYYPHLQIPYIIVDNLTGGYLATEHLLSLGHRRIGIILTGKSQFDVNQEFSLRLQGYKLALSQHRIEFDPDLICVVEGDQEMEEMGYRGFSRLLDLPEPPTAVFATSDYKAIGAMNAARDRGLVIPDDISIVGYDDVLMSQFTNPGLTTVNQNTGLLGKRAAELLLFEWNNELTHGNLKDEIVPRLVVRDSTADYVQPE